MNEVIALYARANDLRWSGDIIAARGFITEAIKKGNIVLSATKNREDCIQVCDFLGMAVNLDDDLRSIRTY